MQTFSWSSIGSYCLFSIFIFYQQLQAKNFQGASKSLPLALNISAFLGMAAGLAYLVYYGWSVVWWAPIAIFVIGLVASALAIVVEKIVGSLTISLCGFIGWPASAYFMFRYVPAVT